MPGPSRSSELALARLVASPDDPIGAPALWSRAARALVTLPDDLDAALRDRVFDRFLAHAPRVLYTRAHAIGAVHRPALRAALARCTDPAARLLRAATSAHYDAVASFVAILARANHVRGVLAEVAVREEAQAAPVLAASLGVVRAGYPPVFAVAFVGMVGALLVHGTAAQANRVLAIVPPGGAVHWLRRIARLVPLARATRLRACIANIAITDDAGTRVPRYKPLRRR